MYLFPHNEEWASEYAKESESILKVYQGAIDLYHIGSTAIPNLHSKNCIDILGVVKGLSAVQTNVAALVSLGYKYKGEYGIKGREYFSKPQRKSHLHVMQEGDFNIKRHLFFVDKMKSTPQLVNELNALKKSLHDLYPNNQDKYQQEKVSFYDEISKLL